MDGIDRLLQIVAYYRRRQPQSPEVSLAMSARVLVMAPLLYLVICRARGMRRAG